MSQIIQVQKDAAKIIGVTPKALRNWMKEPGFPDCSAGYPIEEIREWQQSGYRKGSKLDAELRRVTLIKKAADAKIAQVKAKTLEREEETKKGNILPRDIYLMLTMERLSLARDRLLSDVTRGICNLLPSTFHHKVLTEGDIIIRPILTKFADDLAKGDPG